MAGYLFLPENDAPHLESRGTQAELSQDLEDSWEQEGQLALTKEAIRSEADEDEASGYQDDFEDGEAMESDPAALDKDMDCPREEDTVQWQGSPGCKTCRYLLVRTPRKFRKAQVSGREAPGTGQGRRVDSTFLPIHLD